MNRFTSPATAAIALAMAAAANAELVATRGDDGYVYRMTVTPAAEPTPRLRYRLVTADGELRPGNGATFWYRAMIEWTRDYWRVCRLVAKESAAGDRSDRELASLGQDLIDSWRAPHETRLSELPLERARKAVYLLMGWRREALVEAARREQTDWDLGVRRLRGSEAIDFLLPEFQKTRSLCRVLCLEARVAVAEGRHDDALDALRLNFALALAVAEPPLFVCRLIGGAIAETGFDTLRELQCQPQAPSLYWALADLPRPLIEHREAIRFEAGIGPRIYELLRDPDSADRTDAEWNRLLDECLTSLAEQAAPGLNRDPPPRTDEEATRLAEWVLGLREADRDHPGVRLATERLSRRGYSADELAKMPIGRVLAIDAVAAYRGASDALEAAFLLPWDESAAAREAAVRRFKESTHPLSDSPGREVLPIATLVSSGTPAAVGGFVRQQQTADVLRLVEALRLHAGQTGRLPQSLDKVTCVPVPRNPATGESFRYRLDGDEAMIELPTTDRLFPIEVRYVIQLAD